MATIPNPYDQVMTVYDDEQRDAIRQQLVMARKSGSLNQAQMQSTGKLLITLNQPKATPKRAEPQGWWGKTKEAVFPTKDKDPFEQESGPGAIAREALLGPARAMGMETETPVKSLLGGIKDFFNLEKGEKAPFKVIAEGMANTMKKGHANIKKGETGLGVSQMAAGVIPLVGEQMGDLFQRIEDSRGGPIHERVGLATEGLGIAAQFAPTGAKAPNLSTSSVLRGAAKVGDIGVAAREVAANLHHRMAAIDASKVEFDPVKGRFTRSPATVAQHLHSKIYFSLKSAAHDYAKIAKTLETKRKNAVIRADKAGVTVDVQSSLGTLISDARAKITADPELLTKFGSDLGKVEASLGRRPLGNMPVGKAVEINQLLQDFARYESEAGKVGDFAKLIRQARHQVNDAISTKVPDWSKLVFDESDAMKMTNAFTDRIREKAVGNDPIHMWKSMHSPGAIAMRRSGLTAPLVWFMFDTTPSLTGRAALMSAFARIANPLTRVRRPGPYNLRPRGGQPGAAAAPVPGAAAPPAAPAGPAAPVAPPALGIPAQAPAAQPVPQLAAPVAQPAPSVQPSPTPPAAGTLGAAAATPIIPPAIQQPLQVVQSYSTSLVEKMQAANEIAKYASTNDLGQYVGPKGEKPPAGMAQSPADFHKPKFVTGTDILIQPTKKSQPLFGKVKSVQYNESFKENAYTIELSNGEASTAWESELKPSGKSQGVTPTTPSKSLTSGTTPPNTGASKPQVGSETGTNIKPAATEQVGAGIEAAKPVERFAVYELPQGQSLKATYQKLGDTATLTKVQIGRNTYRNKASIDKILANLGVDEAGLRSQIDQPAAAELHGTGDIGRKAADAERKAAEREKAKREQPEDVGPSTPEDFLIAVESGYEAIVQKYGTQGRTIVNALKTVARQKGWTAEETYMHIVDAIEKMEGK